MLSNSRLISVLLSILPVCAAPALVGTPATATSTVTPTSITIPSTTTGNSLVVVQGTLASTAITAISGCSGTWTQLKVSNTNRIVDIWSAPNVAGSCTSISITVPNTAQTSFYIVSEWSGLGTTNTLDTSSTNTNASSNPMTQTAITTTNANDLLIGSWKNGGSATYSSGPTGCGTWAFLGPTSGNSGTYAAYQIVSSTQTSCAPSITLSGTAAWDAAFVAIKAAAAAGSPKRVIIN